MPKIKNGVKVEKEKKTEQPAFSDVVGELEWIRRSLLGLHERLHLLTGKMMTFGVGPKPEEKDEIPF